MNSALDLVSGRRVLPVHIKVVAKLCGRLLEYLRRRSLGLLRIGLSNRLWGFDRKGFAIFHGIDSLVVNDGGLGGMFVFLRFRSRGFLIRGDVVLPNLQFREVPFENVFEVRLVGRRTFHGMKPTLLLIKPRVNCFRLLAYWWKQGYLREVHEGQPCGLASW